METFVTSIHLLAAVFMILVVLIQGGNQGGISAAFGGGNSQGFFGAGGATTILGKLTYIAAGIFMVTSLWLTVLKGNVGNIGLSEKLKTTTSQPLKVPESKPSENATAPKENAGTQPAQEMPSTTAPGNSPEAAPAAK